MTFRNYLILFIGLFLFLICTSVYAAIHNVPEDYETIQAAIDSVAAGDTVLVERGEYVENLIIETPLVLTSTFIFTQDEEDITGTRINGSEEGAVITIENLEEGSVTIVGLSTINGFSNYGGGIYLSEAQAQLSHLIVEENEAERGGGGVYCTRESIVQIENCQIRDNSSGVGG